jgi:uncharacterized protein YndB with AHSA1/START domain
MTALADATESIDRTITITRHFPAPRSAVFRAFTDKDAFAHWMGPKGVRALECVQDAAKGGRYRLVLCDEHGKRHVLSGEFREVLPDERLVFSWEPQWGEQRTVPTIVTVELHDRDDGTELMLTQSVFSTLESRDHHARFWESSLDCLASYLA